MTENEVAKHIVDVAYKIHSTYGPGLLESVYEAIMAHELSKRGLQSLDNNRSHSFMRMFKWVSDSVPT